jgi:ketosteroid isomerase-like protein
MQRRIPLFILILSVVALLGVAKWTATNVAAAGDAKAEVLKAEDARNEAMPKGDVAALERIYSDDLVYTNGHGELLTKTQHLAEMKARTLGFRSFAHSDVQVTVHGNTGIVTGISTSAVEYEGKISNNPRRFVNVYSKEDGRWLCVAHVETPVEKKQ